jgi:hypothetical protein
LATDERFQASDELMKAGGSADDDLIRAANFDGKGASIQVGCFDP